jgi:transcriptional regulator GlxA family with amidase domain
MIETDDKLAAVAAAAGFCNASYFCKVFRNTTGFTPHCWRRLRRRPESSLK